ncbi:MAG: N-acetylmuramoyl-L-alanine amidase [Verrucomicrobia bacterium]|nr:N-acetylmuramoyl-L-alanine amidase [Verrucomicrobiota bacterium]
MSTIYFNNAPSPNYGDRKNGGTPQFLVMHYTACPTDEALATLTSKASQISSHYLISPEGEPAYKLVDESKRAWHAGVSHWRGIDDVNSFSIGIENVNWGYTHGWVPSEPSEQRPWIRYVWSSFIHAQRRWGEYLEKKGISYTNKQWHSFPAAEVEMLTILARDIIKRHKLEPENIVGHSDIAPQRKVDPGPLFPWHDLARHGVGVWPNSTTDRVHSDLPQGISIPWMQNSLQKWGYKVPQNGSLDPETQNVIRAFQMHFRPLNHEGLVDRQCEEILDLLLCARTTKLQ